MMLKEASESFWPRLTSGLRSIQSCNRSPLITFTVTGPLARTEAQRIHAVVNRPISPTNWPSVLRATKDSRGPRARVSVKSLALDAPCTRIAGVNHPCIYCSA